MRPMPEPLLPSCRTTRHPDAVRGPFLFACDAGYSMQLATALRSLVESNGRAWPLDVHVLWHGPEEACRRIGASLPPGAVTLRWIPVDLTSFAGFPIPPGLTSMMYARLLVPRIFPEEVERVLYLDADLLVLDDLQAVLRTDLQGAVLGAVVDTGVERARAGVVPASKDPAVVGAARYVAEALPLLPAVDAYFNSGMLLIDLRRWREARVTERALAWLACHPESPFGDQDALNVACAGRWAPLAARWNHQDHLLERIGELEPEARPGVVHFVTSQKPWKPAALSHNAALWDDFRDRTAFARSPRERLAESVERTWRTARRALGRVGLVRSIWERVRHVLP